MCPFVERWHFNLRFPFEMESLILSHKQIISEFKLRGLEIGMGQPLTASSQGNDNSFQEVNACNSNIPVLGTAKPWLHGRFERERALMSWSKGGICSNWVSATKRIWGLFWARQLHYFGRLYNALLAPFDAYAALTCEFPNSRCRAEGLRIYEFY